MLESNMWFCLLQSKDSNFQVSFPFLLNSDHHLSPTSSLITFLLPPGDVLDRPKIKGSTDNHEDGLHQAAVDEEAQEQVAEASANLKQ